MGSKGNIYVKPDELFRDPVVREQLRRADRLAVHLGLKRTEGSPRSPVDR